MTSSKLRRAPDKILLPRGFSFSALAAGIKVSGRPDLALIEIAGGAAAAALFTSNRVVAAPVEVGRASLAATDGCRVRAVVANAFAATRRKYLARRALKSFLRRRESSGFVCRTTKFGQNCRSCSRRALQ